MTDTVDDIIVTGQRRSPTTTYTPWPTSYPPFMPKRPIDGSDATPWNHPCAFGASRLEWNADAAAAAAARAFEQLASSLNPPETLNNREWGVALFDLPNGRVIRGNITYGAFTFQNPGPGGLATVAIDYTAPAGSRLIGVVHSHNAGGHLSSGNSPTSGDQDVLRYIRDTRSQQGLDPNQARLYIVALTLVGAGESQYAKISFYNHLNQQAAIDGQEGPEVDPGAHVCPIF